MVVSQPKLVGLVLEATRCSVCINKINRVNSHNGYDHDDSIINIGMCTIIIRPHRGAAYLDADYCYRPSSVVYRSDSRSVTVMSPAKMAKPIEVSFGLRTWVDPKNHVLDGDQDLPWEKAVLRGKGVAHCKV